MHAGVDLVQCMLLSCGRLVPSTSLSLGVWVAVLTAQMGYDVHQMPSIACGCRITVTLHGIDETNVLEVGIMSVLLIEPSGRRRVVDLLSYRQRKKKLWSSGVC